MTDSYNEFSLIPSALDAERLRQMDPDKNVVAENVTWTCCRYPPKTNRPDWHQYTLLVTHPHVPVEVYELHTLDDVFRQLTFLDGKRKKK